MPEASSLSAGPGLDCPLRDSSAPHAASVVFRVAQGGRNVALLPGLPRPQCHRAAVGGADKLMDETRGARFFTNLDFRVQLAFAYMQFRTMDPGGGRHSASPVASTSSESADALHMHHIFVRPSLVFDAASASPPPAPGACWVLGRFVQDCPLGGNSFSRFCKNDLKI